MPITPSRADQTLAILSRAIEQNRALVDAADGLRQILVIVRFDKKTGAPLPGADFKPEIQTT